MHRQKQGFVQIITIIIIGIVLYVLIDFSANRNISNIRISDLYQQLAAKANQLYLRYVDSKTIQTIFYYAETINDTLRVYVIQPMKDFLQSVRESGAILQNIRL